MPLHGHTKQLAFVLFASIVVLAVWYASVLADATGVIASSSLVGIVGWEHLLLTVKEEVRHDDARNNSTRMNTRNHSVDVLYNDYGCTLGPCITLQNYIQKHSQRQLYREYNDCRSQGLAPEECPALERRLYIIVDYSCPHEAGNLLYITMNKMLWGVLTNRTILMRYMTEEVCESICRDGFNDKMCPRCPQANTKADCDRILHVHEWLPWYDDWNVSLRLPPSSAVHPVHTILNATMKAPSVPRVVRLYNKDAAIHTARMMPALYKATSENNTSKSIISQGVYFAYGMLFDSLFYFDMGIEPPSELVADATQTQTIVAHSRHHFPRDTSTYTQEECLKEFRKKTLIGENANETIPCVTYLMADRQVSLDRLAELSTSLGCIPIIAPHNTSDVIISREHGPYAGVGFFQDLALAVRGRHAFTTHSRTADGGWVAMRTSSQLIWSIMNYRAVSEGYPKPLACGFRDLSI